MFFSFYDEKTSLLNLKSGSYTAFAQIYRLHSPRIYRNTLNDAVEFSRIEATRYGRLEHPYLVAIDVKTELPIDEYDIEDALFGDIGQNWIPLILKRWRLRFL